MKKLYATALTVFVVICIFMREASPVLAQRPEGRDFGFGLVFVEPLGGTVKYWTKPDEAIVGTIGSSRFGDPRLGVDYAWHFNAFRSDVVNLYAAPGMVFGLGRSPDDEVGIRGVLGVNVVPRSSPMEMFLEMGPLFELTPGRGTSFDLGLGLRFYP